MLLKLRRHMYANIIVCIILVCMMLVFREQVNPTMYSSIQIISFHPRKKTAVLEQYCTATVKMKPGWFNDVDRRRQTRISWIMHFVKRKRDMIMV